MYAVKARATNMGLASDCGSMALLQYRSNLDATIFAHVISFLLD